MVFHPEGRYDIADVVALTYNNARSFYGVSLVKRKEGLDPELL